MGYQFVDHRGLASYQLDRVLVARTHARVALGELTDGQHLRPPPLLVARHVCRHLFAASIDLDALSNGE